MNEAVLPEEIVATIRRRRRHLPAGGGSVGDLKLDLDLELPARGGPAPAGDRSLASR